MIIYVVIGILNYPTNLKITKVMFLKQQTRNRYISAVGLDNSAFSQHLANSYPLS